MTGFARADGQIDGTGWTLEVKSVNGRNLDIRCRVPAGFDSLDAIARGEIAQRLRRGSVNVTLTVNRAASTGQLRINRELLDQLLTLAQELEETGAAAPRIDGLLQVRGVVELVEEADDETARQRLDEALAQSLVVALDKLSMARFAEGARLGDILTRHLGDITALVAAARTSAAAQPEFLKARLRAQIAALLDAQPTLPEERLAQEAALLISRGDVREELDRLTAHVEAAADMLAEGGAIGRRLDFLCQEFNREANTLCSKSSDVELTRIGLSLKAAIEQLREQVQNIE
ncbi:MAG: YicC family protein [Azospirillaceae bacterium]|nr:YicC family protein [Azospirillaceae bacterium]